MAGRKFVKVPEMWVSCLSDIDNANAYKVALYLLDKACFSEQVPLGNGVLKKLKISRATKWRVLERLGRAGLVAVERRQGRPPLVKVRWLR